MSRDRLSLAKVARECGINANVLSNCVRLRERAKMVNAGGDVVEVPAPAFMPAPIEPATRQPADTTTANIHESGAVDPLVEFTPVILDAASPHNGQTSFGPWSSRFSIRLVSGWTLVAS